LIVDFDDLFFMRSRCHEKFFGSSVASPLLHVHFHQSQAIIVQFHQLIVQFFLGKRLLRCLVVDMILQSLLDSFSCREGKQGILHFYLSEYKECDKNYILKMSKKRLKNTFKKMRDCVAAGTFATQSRIFLKMLLRCFYDKIYK
jgi:hypothetical protein